jgi:hypothetical protein
MVTVVHTNGAYQLVPWYQWFRGPSPQDVALRGVMRVRIQAYMLADIVVAIPAVDLAIEAVVCTYVRTYVLIMLCHNFLIGKGRTRVRTCVP